MIYLLLSVIASTLIFIIFKLFETYKVHTLQAIVFNYVFACLFGLYNYDSAINVSQVVASDWFWGAAALGFLFIAIFNVMALTAQKNGLSVASVASKMSVVIPVIFGFYVYNEGMGLQKIIGILLALVAVYLTSIREKSDVNIRKNLWLPIVLFCGSGVIDTSIKYIETTYLPDNGIPIFSATVFAFAFVIGSLLISYHAIKGQVRFEVKSLIGGFFLGLVNYYSIYYLLRALNHETLESSSLFTINNVAIVMLSTLLGLMVFKERISKKNWIGIGLAICSIVLITLA